MSQVRNGSLSCGVISIFVLLTAPCAQGQEAATRQQSLVLPTTGTIHPSADEDSVRPIGVIDFYGLHRLTAEQLRSKLVFKAGDPIALGDQSHSFFEASRQRLMMVPEVVHAHVDVVCCENDLPTVFVGIEERNAPVMQFRPAPAASIRLPPAVLRTIAAFDQLSANAVMSGNAEEDDSEGHSLLLDPAARPAEDRLIATANTHLPLVRKVLHDSANAEHRAMAAELLGYAKDLQSAVPSLVYAMSDPSEDVRNNAMRALAVFARATKVKPPRVPYKPFVALLNSPVWTDRNKASFALMQMTSGRDPTLLKMLCDEALPALIEMANWRDRSHAAPAFYILGNIAGLDENDISEDFWVRNDRKRVIEVAARHQVTDPLPGKARHSN